MNRIDAMQARVLQAKGIKYLFRRIDDSFQQNPEATNETEILVLGEHNIDVFLYYQRTAPAEYKTRDQGIEDGGFALACARIVGYPMGMPIFFPNGSGEYFRGLADAMGDAHPFGSIGHDLYVKEESNGSGKDRELVGELDRLQMA